MNKLFKEINLALLEQNLPLYLLACMCVLFFMAIVFVYFFPAITAITPFDYSRLMDLLVIPGSACYLSLGFLVYEEL